MSVINIFSKICNLEPAEMICGENYTFEFTVYNEDTTPADLSFVLSKGISIAYYGINEELIYLIDNNVPTGINNNIFTCILNETDTLDIPRNIRYEGKFIYQVVITDSSSRIYKVGQGVLTILPAIR